MPSPTPVATSFSTRRNFKPHPPKIQSQFFPAFYSSFVPFFSSALSVLWTRVGEGGRKGRTEHLMAATLEEYRDILIADTFVDLTRLKLCAQQGVPSEIRGEVWKYLLGVSKVTLPASMCERVCARGLTPASVYPCSLTSQRRFRSPNDCRKITENWPRAARSASLRWELPVCPHDLVTPDSTATPPMSTRITELARAHAPSLSVAHAHTRAPTNTRATWRSCRA